MVFGRSGRFGEVLADEGAGEARPSGVVTLVDGQRPYVDNWNPGAQVEISPRGGCVIQQRMSLTDASSQLLLGQISIPCVVELANG